MTPFAQIAGLIFAAAFLLAYWTIATMFAAYWPKIIAALECQPIPQDAPVFRHARRP
jgi:hypothetical protein